MVKLEDIINKIHCADCLEFMKEMPDNCVDLIVTDPPYGFGRFETDNFNKWHLKQIMKEIARILKDGHFAFIFSGTGLIIELANIVPLDFKRLLWMYKPNDCTYPYQGWLLTSEAILMFSKGNNGYKLRERKPYQHDCYVHTKVGQERVEGHPTVKPKSIILDLVNRSYQNDIICDPFLGSGTTAVACKELGRNFIGIEINPEYCKIAEERLKQEVLPFAVSS